MIDIMGFLPSHKEYTTIEIIPLQSETAAQLSHNQINLDQSRSQQKTCQPGIMQRLAKSMLGSSLVEETPLMVPQLHS